MENKCQILGHDWQSTSVFGFFQCHRTIGIKNVKKGSTLVYCNTVAHCPGCVGARHANVLVVWCALHKQTCNIEDFTVVFPRAGASYEVLQAEQQSLF